MAGKTKYTTYVEPYLHEIKEWARQGDTYKSIAKKLHIGYRTFIGYLERGEKGEEPFHQHLQCFVSREMESIVIFDFTSFRPILKAFSKFFCRFAGLRFFMGAVAVTRFT